MADSEILLQPEILAELKRYRALERRVQVSRQQCQEFNELAKQVAPGDIVPLSVPLGDGSPAAEIDAALSALRQQVRTVHQIETQLNAEQGSVRSPIHSSQASLPLQPLFPLLRENVKIALYVMGGVVLCVVLFALLYVVGR